jgi:hypothetical protein
LTRTVRIPVEIFEAIDAVLPEERTGDLPSRADFNSSDLMEIRDKLADSWDSLAPLDADHPWYRQFWLVGRLVPYVHVIAALSGDGAIDVVEIEIDLEGLPDTEKD